MMLEPQAQAWLRVVRIEGNYIWVEPIPDNACATGGCGASGVGCQTNAFARLLTKQPLLKFPIPDHITLSINDEILMTLAEEHLFQLSLWVYGGSLTALIAGIGLGQWLGGDWLGLVLGIFALLVSWMMLNHHFLTLKPRICEVRHIVENVTEIAK